MSTLTPFGVALRKLRVEKNLRLFDVAERLGKSTALLSAIETGRKPIPELFLKDLSRALNLSAQEIRDLRIAKDQTRHEVDVSHLRGDQREMVAAFARRLDELPEDVVKTLRDKILRSASGEVPFKRNRRGILVPAMSRSAIEALAKQIRHIFCAASVEAIPIINILEFHINKVVKDFNFQVWSKEEMQGDEGRVVPGKHLLVLREDVYDGACRGEGRARFTACHELGHYVMHHEVTFARVRDHNEPIYRDAEWQADTFAGCLMLSREQAKRFSSAEEAAERCGMSSHAAAVTLSKY